MKPLRRNEEVQAGGTEPRMADGKTEMRLASELLHGVTRLVRMARLSTYEHASVESDGIRRARGAEL